MFLKSFNGNEVSIELMGYQYSDVTDYHDKNWILIKFSIKAINKSWSKISAVLLTTEVNEIIHWFTHLIEGNKPDSCYLGFIEPHLLFRLDKVTKKCITFRLILEQEFIPPFSPNSKEYYLDMKVSKNAINLWINDLRNQLTRFPVKV